MLNADPSDREELVREVNHVNEAWSYVSSKTADRQDKLERTEPLAKEHDNALHQLSEAIAQVEDKLNTQRAFGAEPEKISAEIQEIKVCHVITLVT